MNLSETDTILRLVLLIPIDVGSENSTEPESFKKCLLRSLPQRGP